MKAKAKLGVKLTPEREKELKNKFARELIAAGGQWTVAAKNANVTISRVREWMLDDASFREAVYEADQITVDEVEQALLKKIRSGDVRAMCFYLKCKGKERGYIEFPTKEETKKQSKKLEETQFKLDFGN